MKFNDINLRKIDKDELIFNLINNKISLPSKKELKNNQKIILNSVRGGDFSRSRNSIILGLYFQDELTFEYIKKKGLFRYSNYTNKKCIIRNLASEIVLIADKIGCNAENEQIYLQSIINLSPLHVSCNNNYKNIILEIKKFEKKYKGKSLVKTLIAYIDFLFLCNSSIEPITGQKKPNDISSRTKEELSTAVSYIIYLYTDKFKLNKMEGYFVAEKFITSTEINHILELSCLISDLKEFEIMIDRFEYNCSKIGNILKINPPTDNLEKSIRLGYIKSELQSYNDRIRFDSEKIITFEQVVDQIAASDGFDFFQMTNTHGYLRYRVEIPEPIYDLIIEKFIKPDSLFKEEVIYLSQIFKEQILDFSDLKKIQIKNNLTLFDFIKLRRIFVMFYLFFSKEIYKKEKIDLELIYRSLIPAHTKNDFHKLIEKVAGIDQMNAFLDVTSWNPNSDVLFDLQYHSILYINNHYLIPLSIFVNSNSIRNLFASEYKRNNKNLISDGVIDPLVNGLNDSFGNAKIKSYKETPISSSDLDLFAIYEDTLFVFECKHSLHPINSFDLRTTYDYIKKAEKQLDNVNNQFLNGSLIGCLENHHDIDLCDINKIQSCIVLSNRLFNGNVFKYPVRNINEIDNILNHGVLETEEGKFCLWKTDKLILSDLVEYFSLNSKLVKLGFDSLSKQASIYPLKNTQIHFDTYYMNLFEASQKIKSFTSNLRVIRSTGSKEK